MCELQNRNCKNLVIFRPFKLLYLKPLSLQSHSHLYLSFRPQRSSVPPFKVQQTRTAAVPCGEDNFMNPFTASSGLWMKSIHSPELAVSGFSKLLLPSIPKRPWDLDQRSMQDGPK